MNHIQIHYFNSPYGQLILGSYQDELCICDWRYRKMRASIDQRIQSNLEAEYQEGNSDVIELTKKQLDEYFQGDRRRFDIPLKLAGSEFQKSVWQQLMEIPYGQTVSYLELSRKVSTESAIRAVASANGANAISIIVPCHRVIGSDGSLTGYAGGLDAKKKLLKLEGALVEDQYSLFE